MRRIIYSILIIILILICSVSFVSCEAITAQNITNIGSTPGMNGGPGINRGPGINSNGKDNRNLMRGMPGKNN